MLVLKFGGSSVSNSNRIQQVKRILDQKNDQFMVLVSAFSGVTDQLSEMASASLSNQHGSILAALKQRHISTIHELIPLEMQSDALIYVQKCFKNLEALCNGTFMLQELSDKTLANIMGYGEKLSSYIIHQYLVSGGYDIDLLNSEELIKGGGNFLSASVNENHTNLLIQKVVQQQKKYIAPGFIASNNNNESILLGRGGSDYSAAIFANAISADSLEIWSDVDGLMSANPKVVKSAHAIRSLDYQEAFELSYFGAKVLYPPTVKPAMKKEIPIHLKNTFSPETPGTYIGNLQEKSMNDLVGISSIDQLSLLTISGPGLVGQHGSARRVFEALELAQVNVVLISQGCSEQNICIGIQSEDAAKAKNAISNAFIRELEEGLLNPVEIAAYHSVIALVGSKMIEKPGICGKAFAILGENGVNVKAIAQGASERNISIVIDSVNEKKALNLLHEAFFQSSLKRVHIFVAGIGNVGGSFLSIIEDRKVWLKEQHQLDIRVVGIARSNGYYLSNKGVNLESDKLYNGDIHQFCQEAIKLNLRNSILVDNTASEEVSTCYLPLLRESISVVACNKIAASSPIQNYLQLKKTAREHQCSFLYETCVGAALPVIKTIHDLVQSGDEIKQIQAVLSGSLNFIFNQYDGSTSFASVVKLAQEQGYTEPNPLIDLSGVDVQRKILILARETGNSLDLKDVEVESFLPEDCLKAVSVDDLFKALENNEKYFEQLYLSAKNDNKKLKVVAELEGSKAAVRLLAVPQNSPLYELEGKDNIVSINSRRYPEEPLVIKGAGAGAEVTASGVFSDVMLISNQQL